MPDLHPDVLSGMPRAERCPLPETRIHRLLVFGDVLVGERAVLAIVAGVESLVRREMLP